MIPSSYDLKFNKSGSIIDLTRPQKIRQKPGGTKAAAAGGYLQWGGAHQAPLQSFIFMWLFPPQKNLSFKKKYNSTNGNSSEARYQFYMGFIWLST